MSVLHVLIAIAFGFLLRSVFDIVVEWRATRRPAHSEFPVPLRAHCTADCNIPVSKQRSDEEVNQLTARLSRLRLRLGR